MNNKRSQHERVLQIMRRAFDSQEEPKTGHLVEDEELLACWESGLLGPDEHRGIIDHLAACPRCRRELADMIDSGVLELPDANQDSPRPLAGEGRGAHRFAWPRLALAASILIAVGGALWFIGFIASRDGHENNLAQAELQLKAGDAAAAMDSVQTILDSPLDPPTQAKAQQLFQEAGYQAAKAALARKSFPQVLEIEHRVSSRSGESPQLVNLRMQAERGLPTELALSQAAALTDYGFELDGRSYQMAIPVKDKTTDRWSKEYDAAATAHPEDVAILLNRGQFLLSMARHDEAQRCFEQAKGLDDNVPARLGLGLAAFELKEYEVARQQFAEAARRDPNNFAAQLNLGICLNRLGRSAEAAERFRLARELTTDSILRQKIDNELAEIQSKH